MLEDNLDKVLSLLYNSLSVQVLVIFPTLVGLCYVVGFFQVWVALMFTVMFYLITEHSRERERFQKSYLWTLRTLIDKRNELPTHPTLDDISVGIGGAGETHLLETLSTIWWRTNARQLFQHKMLPKIVGSLNKHIEGQSMVDSIIEGTVLLSENAPKLLSVQSSLSSYNSIVSNIH